MRTEAQTLHTKGKMFSLTAAFLPRPLHFVAIALQRLGCIPYAFVNGSNNLFSSQQSRCYKKKKKSFFPGPGPLLLAPLALPLVPPATFLGVMGAPVYGKDLLPGTGGLLSMSSLKPRSTPNEYFVAPEDMSPQFPRDGVASSDSSSSVTTRNTGGGGGARRGPAPRVYSMPVADLKPAFLAMVKKQYTVALYAEPTLTRPQDKQYVFVQRTPLFRFPDVINVQFIELPADSEGQPASTLAMHSGSVFGVDDLGKNRERVNDWLARLDDEVSATSVPSTFAKAEAKKKVEENEANAASEEGGGGDTPPSSFSSSSTLPRSSVFGDAASDVTDSAAAVAASVEDLANKTAVAAPAAAEAIGEVLSEAVETPALQDLVTTAQAAGNFTTLAKALDTAGLVPTLQGPGPYTVFAPTDEAFAKLPSGKLDNLLQPENRVALMSFLTYHVLVGASKAEAFVEMEDGASVDTVNGAKVTVRTLADGTVTVNGAYVVSADVMASNGVIHAVDEVLMPPSE